MHQQVAYYGGVVWCKLSWHTCNEIMIEHVVNDAMAKFIALLTKIYVHSRLMTITGLIKSNLHM